MVDDDAVAFELLDRYAMAPADERVRLRSEILASRGDLAALLDCVEQIEELSGSQISAADLAVPAESKAESAADRDAPRRFFGEYELIREIGRGGMGVVFEAEQLDLCRPVAIKMILAAHLADEIAVDRFQEEARLAARVQHPNIVTVHRVGQHLGQHFFAMDYIAGRSLAEALRAGPFDFDTAVALLEEVTRAVDHLHAQRIIHRDLKPSNILLDAAGRPYVTDFGLAKFLDADQARTRTGAILGTPSYMPPEQAAGRTREITARTDVYSLGAILYEMLTGRPPFVGDTHLDTLLAVLENQPERPRALNRKIPRDLEAIALKCLERDPDHRYDSAAALADDLGRYLRREPVAAATTAPAATLRRWSRREPALALRLVGLSSAILVAQLRYAMSGSNDLQFHLEVTGLLLAWAATSIVFQRLTTLRAAVSRGWDHVARWLWPIADAAFLTWGIALADPPRGAMLAAYPLLIATSGLSLRAGITAVATCAALVCYAVLLVLRPEEANPPHYPAFFAIATTLVGAVTAYQVQRAKLLGRSRTPASGPNGTARSSNRPELEHTVPWE